jgi:hypothetical protein
MRCIVWASEQAELVQTSESVRWGEDPHGHQHLLPQLDEHLDPRQPKSGRTTERSTPPLPLQDRQAGPEDAHGRQEARGLRYKSHAKQTGNIGSGAKCVTLLQEALDIAMQVVSLGAWRLALGAWRLAFGAWRLAFSV